MTTLAPILYKVFCKLPSPVNNILYSMWIFYISPTLGVIKYVPYDKFCAEGRKNGMEVNHKISERKNLENMRNYYMN